MLNYPILTTIFKRKALLSAVEVFQKTWLAQIGEVILLLVLYIFFRHLFNRFEERLEKKKAVDPTKLELLRKIYSSALFFIAALILLQILGLDIAPLLAFGGIGAAALGFASKDAIANFYGGLTIYLTRPFLVGDLIELPARSLIGTIEKIGWYFTTLRDLSKKPVYIPNAVFSTELLINQARMTHRYFDERLPLRYSDAGKIESLIEGIRELFFTHPEIDRSQGIRIFISSFADSSIVLEIRAYTLKTRYEEFMEIRQKMLIRVCELVAQSGAAIGYPVREQVSRPVSI